LTQQVRLTGERLHAGSQLFGVDLARHRAAYACAIARAHELAPGSRILDLGSGSGYGTAELVESLQRVGSLQPVESLQRVESLQPVESLPSVYGLDRVAPDARWRSSGAHFLRADLRGIPLVADSFELIASFQVIEHLRDPGPYLEAIARLLTPTGIAILTTPNRLTSDGVNPFHLHEYELDELERRLRRHFAHVEMLGVAAGPAVAGCFESRLRRIRLIMRIDPLRLRDRLPAGLIEWVFGRLALVVRRGIAREDGIPDASVDDFPIGPADPSDIDLLAVCRRPV
jgi:SAM-dependent methyltransferase